MAVQDSFETLLWESSLSRLYSHMTEHDTGIVTAYRSRKYKIVNGKPIPEFSDEEYTKKENQQRNKSLLAKLQSKGYGVTSVKGAYIENYNTPEAKEVGEHSFFVVDLKQKGNLLKDLRKFGEFFYQDSILFIPKGGASATLWGTNGVDKSAFPGYGKTLVNDTRKLGTKGEFLTKIKNQPFIFESVLQEHCEPTGSMGKWACSATGKKDWASLEV